LNDKIEVYLYTIADSRNYRCVLVGIAFRKEWLIDYEKKEMECFNRFLEDLRARKIDENAQYPPLSRFRKVSQPISKVNIAMLSNVYSVVPFYGTSIVAIYPIAKSLFEDVHGFSPDDVPGLVDFAKSEGRIQFALGGRPTRYENFEFLDPIFELKPPRFSVLPETLFMDEKTLKKSFIEFNTIADLGYKMYSCQRIDEFARKGFIGGAAAEEYKNEVRFYSLAKCLGYHDLTDLIERMLLEDYGYADRLLGIAEHFIFREILNPFKSIPTYSGYFLSYLREAISEYSGVRKEYEPTTEIPFEIGRFLIKNKKLTNACGDLEACKQLCNHYRQGDLHKLMIDLQNGVRDRNIDAIGSARDELDACLENLWKDADGIRRRIKASKAMIPVSMGIIGALAGRVVGAGEGLGFLAGLGFDTVDRIIGARGENISERLAKWRKKDYLIGIFDFKKKLPRALSQS
jgi:hypothetical protein